jgi:hypothetical protein
MAITHRFKGSKGGDRYGYYAYIEDGLLVVGEDWPREGGVIYKNTYANASASGVLAILKKEEPKLYKGIVDYYKENPEAPANDPLGPIKAKLREDFQKTAERYKALEKEEFMAALRANTTDEQAEHGNAYTFYHKLSEVYRLMALRADEYAEQFKGV